MQKRLQAAQFLILNKKDKQRNTKDTRNTKGHLQVLYVNADELFCKITNVETLTDANKPNIISISETKLNQEPTKASRFLKQK